jgi:hypothetical protein
MINMGEKKRKNTSTQTTHFKKWTFWRYMVALLDLHIGSRRSTLPCLTESTLPHSFIQPAHEVEVGYCCEGRIFVRMLVLFRLIRASLVCNGVITFGFYEKTRTLNWGISRNIFSSLNGCPFFRTPKRIRINLPQSAMSDCIFFNGLFGRFV